MKKLILITLVSFFSAQTFAQLKVGKTKAEADADKASRTPKLIGARYTGLLIDFGLYYIEADNIEYLTYSTKGAMNSDITERINFISLQEEADFYHYVLALYENFKDNELELNKYKIVPRRNNLLGLNQLIFDVYPYGEGSTYKHTTLLIGKKGWINLFKNSKIHTLKK